MSRRSCQVPGCSEPHEAHGYCDTHYRRWKRTGSVVATAPINGMYGGRPKQAACTSCGRPRDRERFRRGLCNRCRMRERRARVGA